MRPVRPGVVLRSVVGGVHDDRVVGDAQLVELVEHHANLLVVHDHAIGIRVLAALAEILLRNVRPEVHGRGVVPQEERLVGLSLLLHPRECARRDLFVDGFHALLGEGTRIDNGLFADAAVASVYRRIIHVGRLAIQHAARAEISLEAGGSLDSLAARVLPRR